MNEHEHKGGGFFQGFILGLLVGAGLVFLFGTNKGRKTLQLLLEQVEENTELSDLLEIPEEEEEFMGLEEDEPEREVHVSHREKEEGKPQRAVARVKRFFKGAPKKLVS